MLAPTQNGDVLVLQTDTHYGILHCSSPRSRPFHSPFSHPTASVPNVLLYGLLGTTPATLTDAANRLGSATNPKIGTIAYRRHPLLIAISPKTSSLAQAFR